MFKRIIFDKLKKRLLEPRRTIQVVSGPRQVGKTTLVLQVIEALKMVHHYASADEPTLHDYAWIEAQWNLARYKAKENKKANCLLVLDEIQKIPDWSSIVKKLWDQDTREKNHLKVLLLGSSPLLLQKGLTESLAGRFEIIPATHWNYSEMREAFGWDVEKYIYFGGYPGSAEFIENPARWSQYVVNALIETTISRDILLMTPVNKPALLRSLFYLGCRYSGQILSYQKMVGQLQDAGNTTTLAHYLELLAGAGMLRGVQKFAGQVVRQRGSSPKFQILNTGLMSAQNELSFKEARGDHEYWGHLVESAIGAHISNSIIGKNIEIFYWREGNHEVDFVLRKGKQLMALEVKSGRRREMLSGLNSFRKSYQPKKLYIIGDQGIPIEEFLEKQVEDWFEE